MGAGWRNIARRRLGETEQRGRQLRRPDLFAKASRAKPLSSQSFAIFVTCFLGEPMLLHCLLGI
jgi:hypothetical protein